MNKKKEDVQITRQNILEAARECFFDFGYNKTTLNMIANRANYTRGAVYWHFKDKNELFRAVFDDILKTKANVDIFSKNLMDEQDLVARITDLIWASEKNPYMVYLSKFMKNIDIMEEFAEFDDLVENLRLEKTKLLQYFVKEISVYVGRNSIDPDIDISAYAANCWFLFEGLFFSMGINVGIDRSKNSIEKMVKIILSGLYVPES